jgi:glucan phosphoethanolaminetransferase (alkaline phosphatase superfamily)
MPSLECQSNLLFFHNYYSGGCSTSISVPMIVTRATAEENSLSYQERSIVQVFNENDFTTVVIKRGILSQISSAFLYQGVDYTVDVSSDAEVFQKIDSLSKEHEKLFVMFQLQGSHFYYDNFPEEFNKWSPNCKYDKGVESDSLYINGYDNTILYTDYLLNSMLDSLEKQDAIAAVWYVSDHGQTITSTQGWHGSICDENEYHVPLCIWYSDEYELYNEPVIKQLSTHIHTPINSDNIFYTICGMTHIELPESYAHVEWDISSEKFEVHPRKIIVAGQIRNLDE